MNVTVSGYPTNQLTPYQLNKVKEAGISPESDSQPGDISATDIAASLNKPGMTEAQKLQALGGAIFTLMQIYLKDPKKADELFNQTMGMIKDDKIKGEFKSRYEASKKVFDLIQGKADLLGNGISVNEVAINNTATFQSIGLNFTVDPNNKSNIKINFNQNNCSVYLVSPDGSGATDQTANPALFLDANTNAISITQGSATIGGVKYPTAFFLTTTNINGTTDTLVFIPNTQPPPSAQSPVSPNVGQPGYAPGTRYAVLSKSDVTGIK
jgi:hypothetical protein